jgi:nitrous oxidase accessory protein
VLACGGAVFATKPALAADLCVGDLQPGCFSTIQAAVDAAQDGDTIRIGPGTFVGGIMITKSISLVGVAAAATRIEGGGPVLTIGKALAPDPPTVSMTGLSVWSRETRRHSRS